MDTRRENKIINAINILSDTFGITPDVIAGYVLRLMNEKEKYGDAGMGQKPEAPKPVEPVGHSATADELNDAKEEAHWLREYAKSIVRGIKSVRSLINESTGVVGYHLNGDVAPWDELLEDCLWEFEFVETDMVDPEFSKINHVTSEMRDVLYIKIYGEYHPVTVQFTPVYGGDKYIRVPKEDESFDEKEYVDAYVRSIGLPQRDADNELYCRWRGK